MIRVGSIGYNHNHPPEYYIDHPNGPGAWLFVLAKAPVDMTINGEKYLIRAGSAIMISPHTPCYYRGPDGEGYVDDWFYFNMTAEDIEMLADMGIHADLPIYLGAVDQLSSMIYEMTIEFYSADSYHDEIVLLFTDIFFKRVSRIVMKKSSNEASPAADRRTELANLRSRIYRDPAELPAVAVIAKEVGMSVSGLEHLYKKAFGTSVMKDIVNSRIGYAKKLLLATNMQISEIAGKCGYNCCYSFMRQFKAQTGITPSEFRKTQAAGEWIKDE